MGEGNVLRDHFQRAKMGEGNVTDEYFEKYKWGKTELLHSPMLTFLDT